MDVLIAKPEFALELSEAESIVGPVAVKVDASVKTPLYHRPACDVSNIATISNYTVVTQVQVTRTQLTRGHSESANLHQGQNLTGG